MRKLCSLYCKVIFTFSCFTFICRRKYFDVKGNKNLIDIGINYSIKFGFQREAWEFYNLLGIVQLRNGADSEEIRKTFATAFSLLQTHDYLNIGMRSLCCDNLLVLSNIGFFYQSKETEREFYEYMMKVTFLEILHIKPNKIICFLQNF